MKKDILSKGMILVFLFVLMISSMTVSASASALTETMDVPNVSTDKIQEEETSAEENYGALTPEGNLTLVDDYGSLKGAGKQFITVETKSGAYFYIIIDRDENGMEKVHFLNKVDEKDLLELMKAEDVQEYFEESQEVQVVPTEEELEEIQTEEPVQSEEEPVVVGLPPLTSLLLIGTIFGVSGIGGYFYLRRKKIQPPDTYTTKEEEEDVLDDLDETEFDDEDLDAGEE